MKTSGKTLKIIFFLIMCFLPLGLAYTKFNQESLAEESIDIELVDSEIELIASDVISTPTSPELYCMDEVQSEDDSVVIIMVDSPTANINSELESMILFDNLVEIIIIIIPASCITAWGITKSRRNKGLLDANSTLTIRDQINQVIIENPGIHFREICRQLDKENGVVQYHLRYLEFRENEIKSYEDGGYKRYFPNNANGRDQDWCKLRSALQNSSVKCLIETLYESESPLTRNELSEKLNVTPQGISWIYKKISDLELVQTKIIKRNRAYMLTPKAIEIFEEIANTA